MDARPILAAGIGWLFLASAVAYLLSAEVGFQVARRTGPGGEDRQLGVVIGGLLGLLAILLGFTVNMAGRSYEIRRTLVVNEANAIGTAWLRTDLLPAAERAEMQGVLRAYVEARLQAPRRASREAALDEGRRLQARLWELAAAESRARPNPVSALVVQAVNQVIDRDGERQGLAWVPGVPATLMRAIYAVACLAVMAVGIDVGLRGGRRMLSIVVLVLALATVTTLIEDLDQPDQGMLLVSQKPMADLAATMAAAPAPR